MDELLKILLVDDTSDNIFVLNQILKNDYELFFAKNGAEGIEVAKNKVPDLIILDVMMPVMDGYEVLKRLKEIEFLKDIPVIFMTALDGDDDEMKGLELGAIDYITKPINPYILKARVKNHLKLKKQNDILKNLSMVDGLTLIPNRRRFDEAFTMEWNRAIRDKKSLAILMVDIDDFKLFNDNYGHLEGDECIKIVAKSIDKTLSRSCDMVARFGGEEFVSLLVGMDDEGLFSVAEKIRENIIAAKIAHDFSKAENIVTVSVGGALIYPSVEKEEKILLAKADEMLYKAKNCGKNRSEIIFLD